MRIKSFGAQPSPLRMRRFLAGISQDILSSVSGIDQASISRIERGLARPTPKQRRQLAEVLDVSETELFPGDDSG